ncbi:cobalt-zinc-cadmium efflux system protein [Cryobacterium mesophilum]|uniref:Cation transporter n=1 Tax=Terrimesophilobacter mesophilus TaxID=433647 RepID=A0A4R8VCL2_9MICO|nr:cation diffusion facilitator family transporter [Terrimesophilobacter mesophilus]MBB5633900.1 cobalt-zinc-cadmium efflux system protein [Terrimesophilobacter mesophilus]TFB80573.1 cation transporter [Terrimesophilobacter mesophilus]
MSHHHHSSANRTRLLLVLGIVVVVLVIEVVGAIFTGSLALFADAGHMFSDTIGLSVALAATVIASRPATDRSTFGFQRAEVFGALINGGILLAVAISVGYQAIARLIEPGDLEIKSLPMLVVAGLGLLANVVSALILRPQAASSINMRGAYLEVLGDLLGSVAAIVAAVVILTTGFMPADAIASLAIALMIAPRAAFLLRDAVRVLSESVPVDTSVAEIREHILRTAGVVDVHDVHVWAITSGHPVFSAHVVVADSVFADQDTGRLLDELSACLADHFDVAHSTFQLEPGEHAQHEEHLHD